MNEIDHDGNTAAIRHGKGASKYRKLFSLQNILFKPFGFTTKKKELMGLCEVAVLQMNRCGDAGTQSG